MSTPHPTPTPRAAPPTNAPPPAPPRVQVFRLTSPTCWLSWGYEATLNRIRMVYGEQVPIRLLVTPIYDDAQDYIRAHEVDAARMQAWAREAVEQIGNPLFTAWDLSMFPASHRPTALAYLAAARQGPAKAARFHRAVDRGHIVEGRDTNRPEELEAAAVEAGLDVERFRRDLADKAGLEEAMARQGEGVQWPQATLTPSNLVIADDRGRVVVMEHAFEPAEVEAVIDFLTEGRLHKRVPKGSPAELDAYLCTHGPAPLRELARVFALPVEVAEERLVELAGEGRVQRVSFAGGMHWGPGPDAAATARETATQTDPARRSSRKAKAHAALRSA